MTRMHFAGRHIGQFVTYFRRGTRPRHSFQRHTRVRAIIAAVTALVFATPTLTACGSSEPVSVLDEIQSGHIVVGTKYDQPGMGMRTPDKKFVGVDPDVSRYVINHIAEKNGWDKPKITWRETPSAQRETLIKNGEVGMITATYSINKGRANAVAFGGPYLVTHQALLVRDKDTGITSLTDLNKGKRLCSVSGSTPAQKVKEALPEVQLQEFDSYSSCVEALHQKKVDALTTDATILYGFATQYPGEFRVVDMKQDDGSWWTDEHYGIGHAKGDTKSTEAINDALKDMWASGAYASIVHKNLGNDFPVGDEPAIGDLSFLQKG